MLRARIDLSEGSHCDFGDRRMQQKADRRRQTPEPHLNNHQDSQTTHYIRITTMPKGCCSEKPRRDAVA